MELRNLRYFLTVVEASSISKAAKILNITQPTLSRQLKELEIELGAELFKREPKGIKLTEDGIFLKNRSEEILSLASKTKQEFDNKKKQELAGHITIGCVEADNSDTLAMILEELTQDYPRITFHISSGTSEDITERLDKGLLDIAILLEPISVENYEKLSLPRTERWGLLVPRSSNLANNNYIMPQMLKQTNLLAPRREEIQNMIASWCTYDINDLRIVGTYNLIFNIFTLVENDIGSAIVIEGATSNRNVNNQLKFIPLSPVIQTNCVLIWKKSRILTPVLEEFIKRFKEIIKS